MSESAKAEPAQPIYLRVADILEREVMRLKPGSPLASEHALAEAYDVNRLTARAAVDELERRYLVRRSRGRRTIVSRRIDYCIGPDTAPSWTHTVRAGGGEPRSETVALRRRRPTAEIRRRLGLAADAPALFLARRRYVDGELAAYAQTWLAADLVPGLENVLSGDGSLYRAFADYGLEPARASSRAEFVVAPAAIAEKLEVDGRPMLFRLDGETESARTGRTIETTTSWLRADVFRVVFALERERP